MEELGLMVGFILTLMVYSYLIRDNFLYRIAVYVFVGIAAGFVTIVTVCVRGAGGWSASPGMMHSDHAGRPGVAGTNIPACTARAD